MREIRKAGAWAKFRLLMWKNFLIQRRQRMQTITEILLPFGTMALVLILRSQIEPVSRDTFNYQAFSAFSMTHNSTFMILSGMNLTELSVAYSPRSPVLEEVIFSSLMSLLALNIIQLWPWFIQNLPGLIEELPNLNITEIPPGISDLNITDIDIDLILRRLIRIDAYESSADLTGIYQFENATRTVIAAVQFNDSLQGAEVLPDDVSYVLRFPERPRLNSFFQNGGRSWRTDSVFPLFPTPGPRSSSSDVGGSSPGYVIEMFIALQQVISSELITRLTGYNMHTFPLKIQRYPHPSYHEDLAVEVLQFIFPMFIMLSFSYTSVNIVKAVTSEKELQLKESMKIMGLSTWLHWTAWFFKQFLFLIVISLLVVTLLKLNFFVTEEGFSDYSVFTNTPWSVLFFFMLIYLACTIFFCFMISGIFAKANTAALFTGVIWFLSYIPALILAMDVSMSAAVQAFTCLSINSAMAYGFQLILAREATGGMQWGEFLSTPTPDSGRFLFGHVLMMLAFDSFIYMLIALYLEQVNPGSFGVPQPWYFPVLPSFWFPSSKRQKDKNIEIIDNEYEIIKEHDPIELSVGVQISNLTKIFKPNTAVDNLSLNIYNDQITVLLGHNGAGKSTTISMLTGNIEPTKGSVLVAGYDILNQTEAARAHIGLCPQHNVLFNELTVREHIEFFARLKGFTGVELEEDIETIVEKLELQDKRDYKSAGLSGGQKRRLSVGVALCGASSVVLLDEPTSGMDPSSRRALWDLLQREKRGRSMILTTHFMDEADILGDRVAIMASGRLQCVGSPYFLKRHYGVGYTLVLVKGENFDEAACTKIIKKYIPEVNVKENKGSEVSYNLSTDHSYVFEEILNDLENNSSSIGLKNYGLDATTLEDVFMTVGADVAPLTMDSEDFGTSSDTTSNEILKSDFESSEADLLKEYNTLSGFRLWIQHVLTMWLKLWIVWTRSYGMLIIQILVPILQISATLLVTTYLMSFVEQVQFRPLSLTEGFKTTETWLAYNGTNPESLGSQMFNAYKTPYTEADPEVMRLKVVDEPLNDHYLQEADTPAMMAWIRERVVIGATFADSAVTAWFSNFGYHDIAISLSAVHSSMLRALRPEATINVANYPLEATYTDQTDMQLMVTMMSTQLASGIGSSIGIASAVFIMFYIKERVTRAKLLQKAAGVEPATMWISAAIFDWVWFLIISVTVILTCLVFQVSGLSTGVELGRLYLCFVIYGAAMLPLHYIMSNVFSKPATGFVIMFFINLLLGMMGAQIVDALFTPGLDTENVAHILDQILQFFPLYGLVTVVRSLNLIGMTEWSCMQMCEYLSVLPNVNDCNMQTVCEQFNVTMCCMKEDSHFDWDTPGISRYLVAMIGSCFIFWAILMLIEYRVVQKLFQRKRVPPPLDESCMDNDVVDEIRHVEQTADSTLGKRNLVAKSLTKYYNKHLAVNQVSFTVGESECFGLLGVNGAGKTTTFKMLMGDEDVSNGDAFVRGHSVKSDVRKVHENIGYCPQFDAVFNELTGRETLKIFALMRGLRNDTIAALTAYLAHNLGFTKHLDKQVKQYSGGNKRKLSTAVSMMGYSRLVFLDEPTTGVDPAAKRQVWRAIRRATHSGRGVVLTSHSMEECEALCSRLTIMVNGQFQCLGTPQHLKNKFSQGYTLTIKMKVDNEIQNNTEAALQLEAVKAYVNLHFDEPKLMEEYKGLLTYYLKNGDMPWSRMFGVMELAKRELRIEDYTIAQTTLEQIFLQFTKYQQQGA